MLQYSRRNWRGDLTCTVLALSTQTLVEQIYNSFLREDPVYPLRADAPPSTLRQKERAKQLPIEMGNVLYLRLCSTLASLTASRVKASDPGRGQHTNFVGDQSAKFVRTSTGTSTHTSGMDLKRRHGMEYLDRRFGSLGFSPR